jgi:hypothetical protein
MNLLLPPNLDAKHVSAYNNHGNTLVELLESRNISTLHHPFILGLFSVYTALIALHYFKSDDISWAPHADFVAEEWLAIGFTPEVVDILAVLPYPHKALEGWALAPEAPVLSYLKQADVWDRDTTSTRDDDILPEHVRITRGGRDGNNYIYDTTKGKSGVPNIDRLCVDNI